MSDGNRVEMRDAASPEVGRDDVFAEIELRTAGADRASRIDKQSFPLRCDEEDGIAFANVDGCYFEDAGMSSRFGWKECEGN